MKDRHDLPGPGKLPLPEPRSPAELDRRILQAARERAPRPAPRRGGVWMGGLATAAVLVVAVFITRPAQYPVQTEQARLPGPATSADEITVTAHKQEAAELRDPSPGLDAPPAPPPKPKLAEESEEQGFADAAMGESAERSESSTYRQAARHRAIQMEKRAAASLSDSAGNAPQVAFEMEAVTAAPAAAAPRRGQLTAEELRAELVKLSELLRKDGEAKAVEEYRLLKDHCPACDLPETLGEALEKYLPEAH